MSYTIRVRVIQNDPAKWFSIVEKTVWHYANGGTWAECDGEHTLTMGGSNTSGTLRFKNPEDEYFLVALGIHNGEGWLDIAPDLSPSNTGVEIHPTYYAGGSRSGVSPSNKVVKQTTEGTTITVKLFHERGHEFLATITINYS